MIEDFYISGFKIYRTTDATNTWGITEDVKNFALLSTVDGYLAPSSGSYKSQNQQDTPVSTHVFHTHFTTDIKNGDRIIYDSITYTVIFVKSDLVKNNHKEVALDEL